MFTDASNYTWAGVLTQPYHEVDPSNPSTDKQSYKECTSPHHICEWSVHIRSDHLPLRTFLSQSTRNKKVDNWAVELESFNLKFEYIQGIKNTLAGTLSRIIQLNLDFELPTEKPGHEVGYNFLEDLSPIEVSEVIVKGVEIKPDPDTFLKGIDLTLLLKNETIRSLQAQDGKINSIPGRLQNGDIDGKPLHGRGWYPKEKNCQPNR